MSSGEVAEGSTSWRGGCYQRGETGQFSKGGGGRGVRLVGEYSATWLMGLGCLPWWERIVHCGRDRDRLSSEREEDRQRRFVLGGGGGRYNKGGARGGSGRG
jgi:hypothetical protein